MPVDDNKQTNAALTEQLNILQQIQGVMSKIDGSKSTQSMQDLSKEVHAIAEEVANLKGNSSETFNSMSQDATKAGESAGILSGAVSSISGAFTSLASMFRGPTAIIKSVFSFFSGAVSWAFKLGAAILSIPSQILGGLVDMAANATVGNAELARAIENVRDKWGDFHHAQSSAIKSMQKSFAKTTETGLNSFRIYGNLAERLEAITKIVEGLGSAYSLVSDEMSRDGFLQAKRLDEFRMGLGLAETDMKNIALISKANGESAGKSLTDITKYARGFAELAGVSHKDLSKDMAEAMKNMKAFGGTGAKEMLRASAYARKLGLELKEIAGVLGAFETFDQAAEGAAKLSQAFGVTVDAFKLVSAQNPDEQIDHIRKAMFAAGKSADQFNRQELKLLASQTGMSEEAARAAFSINNQGLSMDELNKKMSDSGVKQMSQAEALKDLSESIKRLVKEMGNMKSSFVSMFLDGMSTGIQRSQEFRGLMIEIRMALMTVWREGFKLGQVLIDIIPGAKELFNSFHAFFEPKKFQKLAAGVSAIFIGFFKGLTSMDGPASFTGLMNNLKSKFFNFFDSEAPEARGMLNAMGGMMKNMGKVIAGGISWLTDQLISGIKSLTDLITGKKKFGFDAAGPIEQTGGFLKDVFEPLWNVIKEKGPELGSALWKLLTSGFDWVYDKVTSPEFIDSISPFAKKIITGLGLILVGTLATSWLTKTVSGGIGGMLSSVFGSSEVKSEATKKGYFSSIIDTIFGDKEKQAVQSTSDAAVAVGAASSQTSLLSPSTVYALGATMLAIGTAITYGGPAFAKSLKEMGAIIGTMSLEAMAKTGLAIVGLIGATALTAGAATILGRIPGGLSGVTKGLLVLAPVAVALGAAAEGLILLTKHMQGVSVSDFASMAGAMQAIATTMLTMEGVITAGAALAALTATPLIGAAAATASIGAISLIMKPLVDTAIDIMKQASQLPKVEDFDAKSKSITSVMNVLGGLLSSLMVGISPMMNSLKGMTDVEVKDKMSQMTSFMSSVLEGTQNVIGGLINASKGPQKPPALDMNNFDQLEAVIKNVKAFAKKVNPDAARPALAAVKKMVAMANEINEGMGNLAINGKVTTNLAKVAGSLGLGGKGDFTVQQGAVQINLGVTVEMSAATTERMLVFRKESVIRDQIQWMREDKTAFSDSNKNKIPTEQNATYTPQSIEGNPSTNWARER